MKTIPFAFLRRLVRCGVICLLPLLSAGCAGLHASKPHVGFGKLDLDTALTRGDIVVLEAVEGHSKEVGYCFGLVRVIDDTKWQVLGIKFFEDRYAQPPGWVFPCWCIGPAHRAYYDALTKVPEADAVFERGSTSRIRGFPFLYRRLEVTYRGKAIQLKAD